MYIINESQIPKNAIVVNSIVAHYLIETKKIPLLGKSEDRSKFYFGNTDEANLAIKNMPFYLKMVRSL